MSQSADRLNCGPRIQNNNWWGSPLSYSKNWYLWMNLVERQKYKRIDLKKNRSNLQLNMRSHIHEHFVWKSSCQSLCQENESDFLSEILKSWNPEHGDYFSEYNYSQKNSLNLKNKGYRYRKLLSLYISYINIHLVFNELMTSSPSPSTMGLDINPDEFCAEELSILISNLFLFKKLKLFGKC